MTTNEEEPRCSCSRTELRKWTAKNGVELVAYQCLRCGYRKERVSKEGIDTSRLPEWDNALPKRWQETRRAFWDRQRLAREQELQQQAAAFWRLYDAHLASDKWKAIRRKVLARCKGVCEGCGTAPAVQVHHLTYDRLGDEMLFDLAAVCNACHEKIHGKPIGCRERAATAR